MEFTVKNGINFDLEYKFINNLKLEKIEKAVKIIIDNTKIYDYIDEMNKNDLMM